MIFTTKEFSIKNIVEERLEFLIPVYQRPYVWDDIELKKLLGDIKHNFDSSIHEYFVGNTYLIKSSKDNNKNQFEVIDGQQRFTTFWLISLCFKMLKIETNLTDYLLVEKDIRFDFDIRKEVYEYLKGLLDGTSYQRFPDVSNFEFLKNISAGIETIKSFLLTEISKSELQNFGNYICENVKFIFNEAPLNTDLNALFVALGNSGIQLQQSDILKARLLNQIGEVTGLRRTYSKIWEACETMNTFFESNVKFFFEIGIPKITEFDFMQFDPEKFKPKGEEIEQYPDSDGYTIKKIVEGQININHYNNEEKSLNVKCRSIISFNTFLLHVLRIHRINQNTPIDIITMDSKKLLDIFNQNKFEDVEGFFELMWKVRYYFDKHIVKWLREEDESKDDEELLLLSKIITVEKEDKSNFSRIEKGFSNIQMLQSVLYFNNVPNQIWLTPFFNFLICNDSGNNEILSDENILKELERIDNILVPGDKKNESWKIMNNTSVDTKFETVETILNSQSGLGFNHYWFYKLEYLLWKNWEGETNRKFTGYRITSKNSIEHIFPQNEEYNKELINQDDNIDWLNSFGNLALLSVGQNSSYSNQDVGKKKIDFENKFVYDSLKLSRIYSNNSWKIGDIKKHQEEMILLFQSHYSPKIN